jgi:hypothetical protein
VPIVQRSLLIVVIAGATAVGGGVFTVVSVREYEFVVDVLFEVESVTIACANAVDVNMIKSTNAGNFLIIFYFSLNNSYTLFIKKN